MLWLVRHGADVSRPIPVPTSRKDNVKYNTDITAAYLVSPPQCGRQDELVAFQQLVPIVASMEARDHCQCGCVENGCHTLKRLFKNVWDESGAGDLDSTFSGASWDIACKLFDTLRDLHVDFSQWEHACISALRIFTFEALGLRHTCCDLHLGARYSPEEVSAIRNEDEWGLELLEELMGDLVKEYRQRGMELEEFVISCWKLRMDEVLTEKASVQLTEEERRDAERIGVRWDTHSDYFDEDEYMQEWLMEHKSRENWVKRLDRIAPV